MVLGQGHRSKPWSRKIARAKEQPGAAATEAPAPQTPRPSAGDARQEKAPPPEQGPRPAMGTGSSP